MKTLWKKPFRKFLYEHLWLLDPSWDRATETPLYGANRPKRSLKSLDAKDYTH